jgi:hypothetical protein
MLATRSTLRALGFLVLCFVARPSLAQASGMSFSVYTDIDQTQDFANMYVQATVIDSSWGCYHGSYMTTTHIYSPSSRYTSSQSSGMYSTTSISINGEYGEYTAYTSGNYTCSCIFGGTAGYGGSGQPVAPRVPSDLASVPPDQYTYNGPGNYLRTRIWEVKDQYGQAWNYASMPVSESFAQISGQNGCNITISTGSASTNSQGRFQDQYGNYSGQSNPIPACAPPYSLQCTSAFDQTISVAGFPFSHQVTYDCSDVAISRQ